MRRCRVYKQIRVSLKLESEMCTQSSVCSYLTEIKSNLTNLHNLTYQCCSNYGSHNGHLTSAFFYARRQVELIEGQEIVPRFQLLSQLSMTFYLLLNPIHLVKKNKNI